MKDYFVIMNPLIEFEIIITIIEWRTHKANGKYELSAKNV